MGTLTLRSRRTGEEYPVELYEKEGCLIIRHSSLNQIFYGMPDESRPEIHIEPFNMTMLPCTPALFAVKCTLSAKNVHIEQIGELTCDDWQISNSVTRSNPLATCQNRAFDKAFIRFMQFDISSFEVFALYSSAEIPVSEEMIPLTDRKVVEKGVTPSNGGYDVSAMGATNPNDLPATLPDKLEAAQETMQASPNTTQAQPAVTSGQMGVPQMQEPVNQNYAPYDIGAPEPHGAPPMSMGMFATPDGFPSDSGWETMPYDPQPDPDYDWDPTATPDPPHYAEAPNGSVTFPTQGNGVMGQNEVPSTPLPWMNGTKGNGQGQPESVPIPKAPPQPATTAFQPPKPITVRRVSYEKTFRKNKVETDQGVFFYNINNREWESPSVDVRTVDLNELYSKASAHIGCDLSQFHGFLAP